MIGKIPLFLRPPIGWMEFGVLRLQCAQSQRGVECFSNSLYHLLFLFGGQHGERHRYRPDLIASKLFFVRFPRKDIPKVSLSFYPESFAEGALDFVSQLMVLAAVFSSYMSQCIHDAGGVVPVSVNLYRFAVPWGRQMLPNAHIHPGELFQPFAGRDQSICIHINVVFRTFLVTAHNPLHHGISLPDESIIFGILVI